MRHCLNEIKGLFKPNAMDDPVAKAQKGVGELDKKMLTHVRAAG